MAGYDGSGNWTSDLFPITDRDNSIPILASKFNDLIQSNLVDSFENCLTVDQQTDLQADFNFNNYKGVSLAVGTAPTDAVNFSQLDGKVSTIVGGANITVDSTDPINPIVIGNFADGYINGGVISNDGTTPDEIIQISAVKCRSYNNSTDILLPSGNLNITTASHWASGLVPGLTDASIFLWADDNAGSPRYIFDDVTGSNLLDATEARKVGAFSTDSSGDLRLFTQYELAGGGIKTILSVPLEFFGFGTITLPIPQDIPLNVKVQLDNDAFDTATETQIITADTGEHNAIIVSGQSDSTTGFATQTSEIYTTGGTFERVSSNEGRSQAYLLSYVNERVV